ncbi:MAG TPA: molybdopterin cofactor-binding domain-containing protein, partial [Longimicrobiales bacterium]
MSAHELGRRDFLRLVGGGIVVFVSLGGTELFDPDVGLGQQPRGRYPDDPNAYLRIDGDGKVWIFSGKIEMGQGVMTSQAQMAAEELGVPFESVHMVLGDTDQCPWDMGTFGSLTTRMFGPALRAAAAEARAVLIGLAATKLAVSGDALVAENGVVYVAADRSKKVSYAELAQGKRISRLVDGKAVLRAAREFAVMGKSPRRVDGYDKVTGRARYAGDIRLPGMLYARLLRPPAHGATVKSVDVSAAKAMAGVTVVQQGDLVAVLHADPEVAGDAVEKLQGDWDVPQPPLDPDRIFDHLVKNAPAALVRGLKGDPVVARGAAPHLFESTFRSGYRAHAPMEPHTAVAEMKDGRMTVWASTQTPFPLRDAIARALNLPGEKVRVITPFVGGGFGGKSAGGQAVEAARLAALVGKPVQVAWTRREEFFYDTFDPASQINVASAVDGDGRITLWDYDVYSAGERGTELFYDVPNARIGVHGSWGDRGGSGSSGHIFAVGAWRAPGAN